MDNPLEVTKRYEWDKRATIFTIPFMVNGVSREAKVALDEGYTP